MTEFQRGDRVTDKSTSRFGKGTVIGQEEGGGYKVRYDDYDYAFDKRPDGTTDFESDWHSRTAAQIEKYEVPGIVEDPVVDEQAEVVNRIIGRGSTDGFEGLTDDDFATEVLRHTDAIAELLVQKNESYGGAALNPVRIFSKSDPIEQLNVRIDDKISRIQRGHEFENEDTDLDLIGYLILRRIAKERLK